MSRLDGSLGALDQAVHIHAATLVTTQHTTLTFDFITLTMNVSATLNVFRLLRDPSLCLPHHTVPNFNHLPIPLSKAFVRPDSDKKVDIKAVVLDKDNCFAIPKQNEVHKPYVVGDAPL